MAGISVDTELVDVPTVKNLFRGLFGLEGPETFLVSWGIVAAFSIVSSSVGLVGMLLLLLLAAFMLAIGFAWLAWREVR